MYTIDAQIAPDRLHELRERIKETQQKRQEAFPDAKYLYDVEIAQLKEQLSDERRLLELSLSSEQAWREAKAEVRRAWSDLKNSVARLWSSASSGSSQAA